MSKSIQFQYKLEGLHELMFFILETLVTTRESLRQRCCGNGTKNPMNCQVFGVDECMAF